MTSVNTSSNVASSQAPASTSVSARLGQFQFHASGKFRVLQLSDIQDGPKVSADTIRLIAAACDAARPDLVVFTGNQIAGYDSAYSSTFIKRTWLDRRLEPAASDKEKTRSLVRSTLSQILKPIVQRQIPFAVTFGNHDFQCGLSLEEQIEIYREFPGCLNPSPGAAEGQLHGDISSGSTSGDKDTSNAVSVIDTKAFMPEQIIINSGMPGTFTLPVRDQYNSRNLVGLTIINSGDYAPEGGYAQLSRKTLQFMKQSVRDIDVRAMVFQHMPVHKFYDLLRQVPAATVNAIQGYRSFESHSYVLDDNRTLAGSYLGEGISCPDKDSGEFKFLQENNYFALSAAHDHRNGFAGVVDGILLAATPTAGFSTYGPSPEKRAARLFEFDVRHPYEPRTQLLEFGTLVGKPSGNKAYALASTYMPNNTGEAINLLRKPRVFASIATILAATVSWFTFGRKK
ncbi:metallophosphoesterase [Alloscardovia venturai]|uniref:Metallophosphoesterase n=1 Tax=Alloscardovia venturai TaxID=1769421 RepID=A0ABW2Y3S1_9BIFI